MSHSNPWDSVERTQILPRRPSQLVPRWNRPRHAFLSGRHLIIEVDHCLGPQGRFLPYVHTFIKDPYQTWQPMASFAGMSQVTALGDGSFLAIAHPRADDGGTTSIVRIGPGDKPLILAQTELELVSYAASETGIWALCRTPRRAFLSDSDELQVSSRAILEWCPNPLGRETTRLHLYRLGDSIAGPRNKSNDGLLLTGEITAAPENSWVWLGALLDDEDGHRRYGFVGGEDPDNLKRVFLEEGDVIHPALSPSGNLLAATFETTSTPNCAPTRRVVVFDSLGTPVFTSPSRPFWLELLGWRDEQRLLCRQVKYQVGELVSVDIKTGSVNPIETAVSVSSASADPAAGVVAVCSTATSPPHVRLYDPHWLSSYAPRRPPHLAPTRILEIPNRGEAHVKSWEGSRTLLRQQSRGHEWRSSILTPAGKTSEELDKLLVWCHGGPLLSWTDWSWRWNPLFALERGYAVLLLEPPLSVGQGQPAVNMGWGRWDSVVSNVASEQVTHAIETHFPSLRFSGAMGGSFGGYLALSLLARGAVSNFVAAHCGWSDFRSVARASDLSWHWLREYGTDASRYEHESLVLDAVPKDARVMLSHGLHDEHVPVSEMIAMHKLLSGAGVATTSWLISDEGHAIEQPNNIQKWWSWVMDECDRLSGKATGVKIQR